LPFENNRFMNMTTVEISDEIRVLLPRLALGCVECEVKIELQNEALWVDIERICHQISGGLPLDEISKQPAIAASRSAYKRCGKDPARYRLSSEALMRRVVKGMEPLSHQQYCRFGQSGIARKRNVDRRLRC
jgi:Uncharacterized conserved protein